MNDEMLEIDWHLTNRCNFSCEYCHPQIKRVLNIKYINERHYEKYIQAFDRLSSSCHILMSGGEPFLFPDFIELCKGLTEKHFISLNTNFSTDNVFDFLNTIPANKVRNILAAIHIEERERLGLDLIDFAKKYILAIEKGFNISAAYVLHPNVLERAEKDIEYLKSLGVDKIAGKVFKGVFEAKRYPDSFDTFQKDLIFKLSGTYNMTSSYLSGEMSFKDKLCLAGVSFIKVDVQGNIQRCATIKEPLGNIFDENLNLHDAAYPCTANRVLVVSQCKQFLIS